MILFYVLMHDCPTIIWPARMSKKTSCTCRWTSFTQICSHCSCSGHSLCIWRLHHTTRPSTGAQVRSGACPDETFISTREISIRTRETSIRSGEKSIRCGETSIRTRVDKVPTVPAKYWGFVKAVGSVLFPCRLQQADVLEPARMLLAAASGLGHAAEPACAESSGSERSVRRSHRRGRACIGRPATPGGAQFGAHKCW